jgi:Ca-activated chloride channel family protein
VAAALAGALPFLAGWSFFDPFHAKVETGNRLVAGGEPDAAITHYDEAARLDPGSPIPDFNRGIALTGQGKAEEAGDAFLGAAAAEDPRVAADALYNLGNVLLDAQQYEPAVEAYLKSLDLDPADADARRNLEIAWRRLEQQQQQQQQDQEQQQQDQDQQDQDQEQQDQEQEPQDPEQDPDQPQDPQSPEDQDQQQDEEQDEEQGQAPEDQEQSSPDDRQQPPVPQDRMSREDAERLLNAVQSDELKVLQKLQDDAEKDAGGVTDDW